MVGSKINLSSVPGYKVELIAASQCDFGDGLNFEASSKTLYYVDTFVGRIHSYAVETKETRSIELPELINFCIPCYPSNGTFIINQDKKLCKLLWESRSIEWITSVEPEDVTRGSCGKCDVKGNLWFSTMGKEDASGLIDVDQGSLYYVTRDRKVHKIEDKFNLPRGMVWSTDNKLMFHVDEYMRVIHVYHFEPSTGSLSNKKVCFDSKGAHGFDACELPDGLTIDQNNKLWVTFFNGGKVVRIDPETGKLLLDKPIVLPVSKLSSICFGGKDFRSIYVTSCRKGLSTDALVKQPFAGNLFVCNIEKENVRGVPCHPWLGIV